MLRWVAAADAKRRLPWLAPPRRFVRGVFAVQLALLTTALLVDGRADAAITARPVTALLAIVADIDGDGALAADDCAMFDASRHPQAIELPGNGIDEDCDGHDTFDVNAPRQRFGRSTDHVVVAIVDEAGASFEALATSSRRLLQPFPSQLRDDRESRRSLGRAGFAVAIQRIERHLIRRGDPLYITVHLNDEQLGFLRSYLRYRDSLLDRTVLVASTPPQGCAHMQIVALAPDDAGALEGVSTCTADDERAVHHRGLTLIERAGGTTLFHEDTDVTRDPRFAPHVRVLSEMLP